MKDKDAKVEVQKGPLNPSEPTYKWHDYRTGVQEQRHRNEEIVRYQTMETYEPKQ